MSYKDELVIDKNNLDEEWEQQALKFADWAEKGVLAEFDRDKKKERLELVRAKIDSECRTADAEKAAVEPKYKKITEAGVIAYILQDEEYQQANAEYIEAVRDAKIFRVAETAFDHRKKALEKLTDLFISNYWSRPAITADKKQDVESRGTEEVRRQLNDKRKKR